jgi:hypothetical protein
VAPTTTTLITSNCAYWEDLNDASGNYIRTACVISQAYSHSDADAACQALGMALFHVDVPEIDLPVRLYMNKVFGVDQPTAVHVNGVLVSGSWIGTPMNTPVSSGITWVNSPAQPDNTYSCMRATNHEDNTFKFATADCSINNMWPVCQYIRPA